MNSSSAKANNSTKNSNYYFKTYLTLACSSVDVGCIVFPN